MANLFRANKKGSGIEVTNLVVTTQPTKTSYLQDTEVDLSGAVITATLKGGITVDVTAGVDISPQVLSNTGTQTVTLSYGNASVDISVNVYAVNGISVTTSPTTTQFKTTDPIDYTGIVVKATGGTVTEDVTSDCTFDPVEGSYHTTEETFNAIISYVTAHGTFTTTQSIKIQDLPTWDSRGLQYNSWDTIKAYTEAGALGDVAAIGNTKTFTYNGKTLYAELVNIGDNSNTKNKNYYPLGTADFITKDCLSTTYKMNSSTDYFTNNDGWKNQPLRTTLNSTIYNALPSDLKAVIIDKVHTYDCGSYSPQSTSASSWTWYPSYQSLSDKLWLPTVVEVGLSPDSGSNQDTTYNKTYGVFTNDTSRIKKVSGSASIWWLSSPYSDSPKSSVSNTRYFRDVAMEGGRGSRNVFDEYGLVLGFRIG